MAYDTVNPLLDNGVWAEFNGSSYLIAHISNSNFQRELARRQQPYRRKIEAGQMDPMVNRDLLCDAMGHGLIRNWRDVKAANGEIHEYTAERGATALRNDPELRDFVTDYATNMQNYRNQEVAELGKS